MFLNIESSNVVQYSNVKLGKLTRRTEELEDDAPEANHSSWEEDVTEDGEESVEVVEADEAGSVETGWR